MMMDTQELSAVMLQLCWPVAVGQWLMVIN